jgi:hypothetical protein
LYNRRKKGTKKRRKKDSKIIAWQRIARLWDEQWLDAIGGQANDVSSRLAKLADWGARIKAKEDMDTAAKVSVVGGPEMGASFLSFNAVMGVEETN